MEAKRLFLGFDRPAVRAASELLVDRYMQGRLADLSPAIVVVPGARAGRSLRSHLVRLCGERDVGLLAPQIVTLSHLPEKLYRPRRPFASVPLQQMMWGRGLRELDRATLQVMIPNAPDHKSGKSDPAERWTESDWLDYGTVFWRQYRALAAEGLSFADVCEISASMSEFPELRRWQAMAILQNEYLRQLDAQSLWDKQTARLVAVRGKECTTDADVYLLGTTDLNRTSRQMLDQVSDRVTPLIHAPAAWADQFDKFGCLDVPSWCERHIELDDEQWSVAERPSDQARILATHVGQLSNELRFDEVRVGCADERLVPFVRRVFSDLEVPCRWGPGRAIEESGPYQLLKNLHDWLVDDRFANLAMVARHPQVGSWLTQQGIDDDWLSKIDRFHESTLPSLTNDFAVRAKRFKGAEKALQRLSQLRERMMDGNRPAAEWAETISGLLNEIYSAMPKLANDVDNRFEFSVCERIQTSINTIISIPNECSGGMSAAEVLAFVLSQLKGESIPPTQDSNAIELLGWLELPLDDAPHLFIGGLNEGVVPHAMTSDLFLPNRIREHLGIDDDRRRLARDAYALTVLLHSRKSIHLVTSKSDSEGNPLKPSRLLFATTPEKVADRWKRILESSGDASAASFFEEEDRAFGFRVPDVVPQPPIDRIRVTDFKTFLQCSYRYYLSKRLGLRAVEHEFEELNAADFGTLVHEVLGHFGNSTLKDSTNACDIQRELVRLLDREAKERLGTRPLAAVQIQVSQIKQRLKLFAETQAQLVDDGWRIFYSESSENDATTDLVWNIDGHDVTIVGRIDRIDYHEADDVYRILDYKTYDQSSKKKPEKTHRLGGEWIDLQLPLYRHLASNLGVVGQPQLGYFILGKNAAETGVYCADWNAEMLDTADERAREVISRILNNDFDAPVNLRLDYDTWKYICLEDVPQR